MMVITNGTSVKTMKFYYDAEGRPMCLDYNGTMYFYITNLQGDVVALSDQYGEVIRYEYDAWGKPIVSEYYFSTHGEVMQNNPLRYRGYIYDNETGFYYLQSRYYDPVVGRFINADGYVSTGQGVSGYNMYAYCGNNPVNRSDSTGDSWVLAAIVVTVCVIVLTGCSERPTSDVGSARSYQYVPGSDDEDSPNCYAYAIGSSVNEQPGDTSKRTPNWSDVEDVGKSVEADLIAKGYTVRRISGPNAKVYDNEYKIALRVGTIPDLCLLLTLGLEVYDYHFMVQTDTGCWAEKHGASGESIYWDNGLTPDELPWTLHGHEYYNSKIIYYAIGE
ncbi:MAG: RHS repeat-associated core domain-containing protein [Clostridia bacterium]|nr:RHS repeat-associated core domain-containing protein [Clostridia bacterium]